MNLGWGKEKIKGQSEFTTFSSPGTGRDEKGASIDASSIHIGAPVGASSLSAWFTQGRGSQYNPRKKVPMEPEP
jgi:hypothetical protein